MQKFKPSILIIEDDANLVLILTKFIETLHFNVNSSYKGKKGIEMALSNKYQLFIIDLGLPDINGLKIIDRIRDISNKPIIVITGNLEENNEINTYKYKANIFHKKPINYDILEAQIKSLISPDKKGNIICTLDIYADINKRIFRINNTNIYLTKTEYNFLVMLLNSNGEVYTREKIISNIMNYFSTSSENCVDTMVSRIRKKLKKENKDSLIKTVNKIGYSINPTYLQNITRKFS